MRRANDYRAAVRRASGSCPHHGSARKPAAPAAAPNEAIESGVELPGAYADRDERGFAWWAVGAVATGQLSTSQGSTIASLIRIINAMGLPPASEEEALREAEFRGRIRHGSPPRTPEEWQRAAQFFDDEALERFRGWEASLEGDGRYIDDPEGLVDGSALEGEMPAVADREDGGGTDL